MNRRDFLKLLGIAAAGIVASEVGTDVVAKVFVPPPKNLEIAWSWPQLAYPPEDFKAKFIDPAVKALADRIDQEALGLSMRFIRQYDARIDEVPKRLDVFYGWASFQPEFAVRANSEYLLDVSTDGVSKFGVIEEVA